MQSPADLDSGLSLVVPVFNSEGSLADLVTRIEGALDELGRPYEILLVNDGSADSSWNVVAGLARAHASVRGIDLMRNYGQHNALLCGIRQARYDITITLDDDLQNPPEEIPRLLQEIEAGRDVVYGVPERQSQSLPRTLASNLTRLALRNALGAETARNVSPFRAFRTDLRRAFDDFQSPSVSIDVLLTWATANFGSVPVRHDPRREGRSNYSFLRLLNHALDMMTGFSTLPLRLASWVGFFFTLFGILVLVYVVGSFLIYSRRVPGFAFLASIVAIFSGAQLFALGIIGEYLARIHGRSMSQPPFTVRETTGPVPSAAAIDEVATTLEAR